MPSKRTLSQHHIRWEQQLGTTDKTSRQYGVETCFSLMLNGWLPHWTCGGICRPKSSGRRRRAAQTDALYPWGDSMDL